MYLYGLDITYIIFVVPAILLGLIAQLMVKRRFAKYDKVLCKKNVTGAAAAKYLLKKNGIDDVKIGRIRGQLSDNYNPSNKVLSLSDSTFESKSIAAIGVAAHETGHAIQHSKRYVPLIIRRALVPVANFGSQAGPLLIIAGLAFNSAAQAEAYLPLLQLITDIGLIVYAASVSFYFVTLPVEFNASRRALKILAETGVFDKKEIRQTRKVLTAAALTYVASALTALGNFIRLLVIVNNRRKR